MKMKVSILVLVGVVAIFLFAGCTSYGPGELSDSIREGQWERDLHHNATESAIHAAGGPVPNFVIPGEGR